MSIAVENLPIIFLGIVGLGVIIILIGIMKLANHQESDSLYTSMENKEASGNLEELFSFFLQEEEKKNQNFREMVMQVSHLSGDKETIKQKQTNTKKVFQEENTNKLPMEREVFNEIIQRYKEGQDVETIAKDLKKGTGEVKLIISLYSMR